MVTFGSAAKQRDTPPGGPRARRVLVVDDDERVCSAVPRLIASWSGYQVAGVLTSADDLAQAVIRGRPDVVLLDLDMPGRSPFHAMQDLRYRGRPCKVLVLSGLVDEPSIRAALDAGADGYVAKDDGPEAIREGLEALVKGGVYLSPRIAAAL